MRKLLFILLALVPGFAIAIPASALTVSPARIEITGDPGTILHSEIELFNEQDGARTFYTSYENFEPSGDSGAPHFIGAKEGLATWFKASSSVSLKSGERVVVPFTITIPKDAEPGGHFAAVFFGSQAPGSQAGGEVSIGGKIGVLILLRVAGDVPEGGGLLEFGVAGNKRFHTTLPISFIYRINNTGGDRIVPNGSVSIKNSIRLNSANLLANEKGGSVLSSSARKFEVIWGEEEIKTGKDLPPTGFFVSAGKQWNDFHFGWYTARLNLSWGDNVGQNANASYHFFVLPWQLLIIIFVILSLMYSGASFGLKKYNRWIIAQATQK